MAVHRLRRRYRELIRARIAETVGEDEVEDELRHVVCRSSVTVIETLVGRGRRRGVLRASGNNAVYASLGLPW